VLLLLTPATDSGCAAISAVSPLLDRVLATVATTGASAAAAAALEARLCVVLLAVVQTTMRS
jgi:hypothetical protein